MLLHLAVVILIIFTYATFLFLIVNWLEYEKLKKVKNTINGFSDMIFTNQQELR